MSKLKFKCLHCKQKVQTTSGGITLESGVEVKVYCSSCGMPVIFTATYPDQKMESGKGMFKRLLTEPISSVGSRAIYRTRRVLLTYGMVPSLQLHRSTNKEHKWKSISRQ